MDSSQLDCYGFFFLCIVWFISQLIYLFIYLFFLASWWKCTVGKM